MAVTLERPRAQDAPRRAPKAARRGGNMRAGKAVKPPASKPGRGVTTAAKKPSARAPRPKSVKAKTVKTVARTGVKAVTSPHLGKPARRLALAALRETAQRMVSAGATSAQSAAERVLTAASTATAPGSHRRPPIQVAVDAAVPVAVAWREWLELSWLPEGVDEVVDIRRRGRDQLRGQLRGANARWVADILDERRDQSFAWQSRRGSDCAGLVTFHRLSDGLTRIELSLDVKPVGAMQALALSTRLADRRAAAELRRFKARLELISPDDYDETDTDS